MRILAAEDEAILADGVLRSLRQSGFAAAWATGSRDSIA